SATYLMCGSSHLLRQRVSVQATLSWGILAARHSGAGRNPGIEPPALNLAWPWYALFNLEFVSHFAHIPEYLNT
ncbi:MAG: hypothetical protein AB2719_18135, partial [Candidatus Thiodiazotropha sp.]